MNNNSYQEALIFHWMHSILI